MMEVLGNKICESLAILVQPELTSKSVRVIESADGAHLYADDTEILHFHGETVVKICLPNIKDINGGWFASNATRGLQIVDLPNAVHFGDGTLINADSLVTINMPNVKETGRDCLKKSLVLKNFKAESLVKTSDGFLASAPQLETIDAENLKYTGHFCFVEVPFLRTVKLPHFKSGGTYLLFYGKTLKTICLPEAVSLSNWTLSNQTALSKVDFPMLKMGGNNCHPMIYEAIHRNKIKSK